MTPNALRQRSDLVAALADVLPELPDDEKQAAVLVLAWLARNIATEKLDEPDPIYLDAVRLVAQERRCSTSWLQRKLGLGYHRAAAIVAEMEGAGWSGRPTARTTAKCWFVVCRSDGRRADRDRRRADACKILSSTIARALSQKGGVGSLAKTPNSAAVTEGRARPSHDDRRRAIRVRLH